MSIRRMTACTGGTVNANLLACVCLYPVPHCIYIFVRVLLISAEEVNSMVARVKANTGKHVAVHLTPGVGGHSGNTNYYKGADFVYLQFGWHIHGNQVSDTKMALGMLKEALKLGIPVVANEYSIVSTSEQARALGDLLCQNGAVGTGNGRNIHLCGQRRQRRKSGIKSTKKR